MRCKRKERTGRVGGCRRVVDALCGPTELHLMRGHSGLWGRGARGEGKMERPLVSLCGDVSFSGITHPIPRSQEVTGQPEPLDAICP